MASKRSQHDKEMAARLKDEKDDRRGGICCICYRPIPNDSGAYNHYSAHARGSSN
jgi:hypothetical protein